VAVAIRHVPFEDLGNLEPRLRANGYRIEYKEAGVDPLIDIPPDVDLLVVLGGPIGAYEEGVYPFIREELRLLEKRLAGDLPTLGICLGAQMMARALGANVHPGPRKELGWGPLAFARSARTSALNHLEGVRVLHWHGDTFDIPAGAIHLASTESYPSQAFSWGRNGLALQFHAEVREATLERWYIGHACEIAATPGVSVAHLRAEAAQYDAMLQMQAAKLWETWLSALS
jgi:GMP synthase (glutamine-hydrolysing)